jgi:hypothetical protein
LCDTLKGLLGFCFRVVPKVVGLALEPLFLILEFSLLLAAFSIC